MVRRALKVLAILIGLAGVIGLGYLAIQPDPGPYTVALHSDTPEQVSDALDAILAGDTTIVYDGSTYPPVPTEELQVLGMRYFRKIMVPSGEPLRGDTSTWMGFAARVAAKIQDRQKNPDRISILRSPQERKRSPGEAE